MRTKKAFRQIAIDGSAGSGKSTVGKVLAEKLEYSFIDSGLCYRVAAFAAIEEGLENQKSKWVLVLQKSDIVFHGNSIVLNRRALSSDMLHSKEVDALVSPISTVEGVRHIITDLLRSIAHNKNIVMAGRDIGSVVLQDAFLKIYLTATDQERASRRFKELIEKGMNVSFKEIYNNIRERDLIDSTRLHAPLSIPIDAYVIDTTKLSIEEVVGKILTFLDGREYALRNSTYNCKTSF